MNALTVISSVPATIDPVATGDYSNEALHAVREGWLAHATDALRPVFVKAGSPIPANVRFSIGFCSTGARGRRIGECWQTAASADGHFEIFISPTLSDPIRVLDVLIHELCHAALPANAGHGPLFKKLATSLGLTGPMTSTVAGPELTEALKHLVSTRLGKLPHGELRAHMAFTAERKPGEETEERTSMGGPKKQANRWLKARCTCCDYSVRLTRKHALTLGAVCPEHGTMIVEGL